MPIYPIEVANKPAGYLFSRLMLDPDPGRYVAAVVAPGRHRVIVQVYVVDVLYVLLISFLCVVVVLARQTKDLDNVAKGQTLAFHFPQLAYQLLAHPLPRS